MIIRIEKKTEYVYHDSFHIMDPAWGHMVMKMSGHPRWPAARARAGEPVR